MIWLLILIILCSLILNLLITFKVSGSIKRPIQKLIDIAKKAGFEANFMGHRQKAGFIGHGVGIELNEAPVFAPRSKDILAEGMVFALEPKFVIPQVGAVGIENTFVVTASGIEKLTQCEEEILPLD